jgi:hypothetical protein
VAEIIGHEIVSFIGRIVKGFDVAVSRCPDFKAIRAEQRLGLGTANQLELAGRKQRRGKACAERLIECHGQGRAQSSLAARIGGCRLSA